MFDHGHEEKLFAGGVWAPSYRLSSSLEVVMLNEMIEILKKRCCNGSSADCVRFRTESVVFWLHLDYTREQCFSS